MVAETHGRIWFEYSVKLNKHFFLIVEGMKYIEENYKIKAVVGKESWTAW